MGEQCPSAELSSYMASNVVWFIHLSYAHTHYTLFFKISFFLRISRPSAPSQSGNESQTSYWTSTQAPPPTPSWLFTFEPPQVQVCVALQAVLGGSIYCHGRRQRRGQGRPFEEKDRKHKAQRWGWGMNSSPTPCLLVLPHILLPTLRPSSHPSQLVAGGKVKGSLCISHSKSQQQWEKAPASGLDETEYSVIQHSLSEVPLCNPEHSSHSVARP